MMDFQIVCSLGMAGRIYLVLYDLLVTSLFLQGFPLHLENSRMSHAEGNCGAISREASLMLGVPDSASWKNRPPRPLARSHKTLPKAATVSGDLSSVGVGVGK